MGATKAPSRSFSAPRAASTSALSQFQFQPFHLVTPSPWMATTTIICTTNSNISSCNVLQRLRKPGSGVLLLGIGLATTVAAMALRFRDVVAEGTFLGDHTFLVQKGITLGVALFLISEVFFFISVFWAFFHSSLAPTVELGAQRPPVGITTIKPFELPLLNTILLLWRELQ